MSGYINENPCKLNISGVEISPNFNFCSGISSSPYTGQYNHPNPSVIADPKEFERQQAMKQKIENQNNIFNIGIKEADSIRKLSEELINFYDNENSKGIESSLTQLHLVTQKFGAARGLVPWISKHTGLKFRYNITEKDLTTDKAAINLVIDELKKNIEELKVDIGNVDKLTLTLQDYYEKLTILIQDVDVKILEAEAKISEDKFESPIEKEFTKDQIDQLKQKILDLKETQETSVMLAAQLRMIRKNNFDLFSLLNSRVATRVPTLLASVAVKTITGRSKTTLSHLQGFDKGSDKLLINTNREISENLKDTSKQRMVSIEDRKETLDLIKNEILETAQELKQLNLENSYKREELIKSLDGSFGKKLLEIG